MLVVTCGVIVTMTLIAVVTVIVVVPKTVVTASRTKVVLVGSSWPPVVSP